MVAWLQFTILFGLVCYLKSSMSKVGGDGVGESRGEGGGGGALSCIVFEWDFQVIVYSKLGHVWDINTPEVSKP